MYTNLFKKWGSTVPCVFAVRLEESVDPVALLAADHLHRHLEPFADVDVNHFELWDLSGLLLYSMLTILNLGSFPFSLVKIDRLHSFPKLVSWWHKSNWFCIFLQQHKKHNSHSNVNIRFFNILYQVKCIKDLDWNFVKENIMIIFGSIYCRF